MLQGLLDRLRGRLSAGGAAAGDAGVTVEDAAVPDGHRVYVVGDIHGRADLLADLVERIAADARRFPDATKQLVYLGDYVDRGPHSRQVIDIVLDATPPGFSRVALIGNHEEAMRAFLVDPVDNAEWVRPFGGAATLLSYGVSLPPGVPTPERLRQAAKALEEALPVRHRQFLEDLVDRHALGDFLFVHAGVDPGRPLTDQRPQDLRWIREPFLSRREPLEKVVVHGHTITETAEFHPNRIGLDTGAYFSDRLSCLVLSGREKGLLPADPVLNRK